MFAMFDPMMFPSAIPSDALRLPMVETNSSGAVVANAIMVTPSVAAFTPQPSASADALPTRSSAPT